MGLTIREFVSGDKYTGFTKAGTRIPIEEIDNFKKLINSIDTKNLPSTPKEPEEQMTEEEIY